MRFMIIVKANEDSEAGVLPDEKILTEMGKFNEELVKAGVMLAGEEIGIGRPDTPVIGGDAARDLFHPVGVVPEVWIVAGLLAEEVGDDQHPATGAGVCREQLRAPIVVTGAIQDDVVGGREGACIGGAAFVLVRIHTGVADDTRDADLVTAELGRAATRLPTVVYWYRQGISAHEIGRRLSPFGGTWDAEHALAVAAALIAYVLNQGG